MHLHLHLHLHFHLHLHLHLHPRFAHSEKPGNRLFCLEVLGRLVHSEAVVARAVVPSAAMFACVFGRCSDVSPSVRSAALKTLAEMTEGGGAAAALLAEVLASDAQGEEVVLATVLQDEEADLATMRLLPSRHRFITFIRRRALDQSVAVRRSALQVLENLLRSSEAMMADGLVEVMAEHCRDSSLAVRKQMVASLSERPGIIVGRLKKDRDSHFFYFMGV